MNTENANSNVSKAGRRAPLFYLIDEWLPSADVHLIGGPSGVGKTTLIFELAAAWTDRAEWLGRATHGQNKGSLFYVAADRGAAGAEAMMERLGILNKFQWRVVSDKDARPEEFYNAPDDTRILIIDCAERLVENGQLNHWKPVSDVLLTARAHAEARNMAVILIVGTPKMKRNEEYVGRERAIGSAAWGRLSGTMWDLRPADPGNLNDPRRMLYVYPREARGVQFDLILTPQGFSAPVPAEENVFAAALMGSMTPSQAYERAQLMKVAEERGISDSTLDRTLARLIKEGKLKREAQGLYVTNFVIPQHLLPTEPL